MEMPQKKNMMYVYKFATGKQTPDTELPEQTQNPVPHGIRQLRKSKTCREKDATFRVAFDGDRQDGNSKIVEGRKSSASNREARKSVSHMEASDLLAVTKFLQVKVLTSDMPGLMQVHAFRCARRTYDSLEKFSSKQMACNMKKEFDKVYGPAWHCIVGSSFGSFVTHSTGCFLYFSIENIYILIFKTKVQKAVD